MTTGIPVFRLQFSIDGEDVVSVALGRLRHQLHSLGEFWTDYVAPRMSADIQANFEQEGALSGGWAPLSPGYARWKAAHYPSRGLMVRTGRLARSLRYIGRPGLSFSPGPDMILEASDKALVFGTRVPYARFHQRPTGTMARRKLLFLAVGASLVYGKLLHQYAITVAARSGLRTRLAIQSASGVIPTSGGPGGSLL